MTTSTVKRSALKLFQRLWKISEKHQYSATDYQDRSIKLQIQRKNECLKIIESVIEHMCKTNSPYEIIDCDDICEKNISAMKELAINKGFKVQNLPVTNDFIIYYDAKLV